MPLSFLADAVHLHPILPGPWAETHPIPGRLLGSQGWGTLALGVRRSLGSWLPGTWRAPASLPPHPSSLSLSGALSSLIW